MIPPRQPTAGTASVTGADALYPTQPAASWLGFTLVSLVVTAVTLLYSFPATFTGLQIWDDTGYMLALARHFNAHGELYTHTFSQYGPLYSEFYAGMCRVLGVPATQDGIRWIAVAAWQGGAVAGGVVAFRVTRHVLFAALAQAFCFLMAIPLQSDAGHPIGLCVCCAALAGLSLPMGRDALERMNGRDGGVPWGALLLGSALGALALVKINLGVFALAAGGTAWAFSTPKDRPGHLLRWVVGTVFCLLPLLLLAGKTWSLGARASFSLRMFATFLAVLVVTEKDDWALTWRGAARTAAGMIGGWVLVFLVSIGWILATGSRPADVLDGMVLRPARLQLIFNVEMLPNAVSALSAVAALAGALAWRSFLASKEPDAPRRGLIEFGLRVFVLGFMALCFIAGRGFTSLLPFLWIMLLPVPPANELTGAFTRRVLVLMAAAQSLSLYPVSGVQFQVPVYFAALAVILVAAQIREDLARRRPDGVEMIGQAKPSRWLRTALIAVPVVTILATLGGRMAGAWRERVHTVSFSIPGARRVHGREGQVAGYNFLAANLGGQRSFLTLPGMNTIYSLARVDYPAGLNCTENFALLSPAEQDSLVKIGRRCGPVVMVYNQELFDWWVGHGAPSAGPLVDFQRRECRPIGRAAEYTLLRASEPGGELAGGVSPAAITWCALLEMEGTGEGRRPSGCVWVKAPDFQPVDAVLVGSGGEIWAGPARIDPPADGASPLLPSCRLNLTEGDLVQRVMSGKGYLRLRDAKGQRVCTLPFFFPADNGG